MVAPRSATASRENLRRRIGVLAVAAVLIEALLVAFTLLYVNTPPEFNVPYGLNPASISAFRALWAYPIIPLQSTQFGKLAGLTIGLLWGAYLAAAFVMWRMPRASGQRQRAAFILVTACIYNIEIALFLPPVLSGDVQLYALIGRMVAIHHLNPYVVPVAAVTNDPFWPLTVWRGTTQYGPLWTSVSAAAALLGGDSMLRTVLIFKVIAAFFNVGGGALVFLLARRFTTADPILALLLYAWNPLVLIESAGSAHNDIVMIAIALFGVLLLLNRRILGGVAVLVASAMVKYLTGLLLFLWVVYYLSRETSRVRTAALMGTVGLSVVAASYLPFLSAIERPAGLSAGPASGVTLSLNPMPNPLRLLLRTGVARLLTTAPDPSGAQFRAETITALLLNGAFAIVLVVLGRRVVAATAGWAEVFGCFGLASLIYSYVVYGNSFPWHLLSPFTAAVLGPATKANVALLLCCIGLGVVFMASYA